MKTKQIYEEIITILKKHGVKKIAIFGSYARNEQTPDSDIDIIAEFSDGISLLELVGIEQELKEALEQNVDLLTENAISPYLIDSIKKEMKVIYHGER